MKLRAGCVCKSSDGSGHCTWTVPICIYLEILVVWILYRCVAKHKSDKMTERILRFQNDAYHDLVSHSDLQKQGPLPRWGYKLEREPVEKIATITEIIESFEDSGRCLLCYNKEKERSQQQKRCDRRAVWIERDGTSVSLDSSKNGILPA